MSRLLTTRTSTTAVSALQQLQPEPSATNSVIKTQAALHATRAEAKPQQFEVESGKYPFNGNWYANEYIEAVDAQELLSVSGNFSDGKSIEADIFFSGNTDEDEAGWAAYKIRESHEFQKQVERLQGKSPKLTPASTAVFFLYLSRGVRYGNSKLSIDALSTEHLLSSLRVSPAAVADVFGRPDYWSPGHYVDSGVTEFWCQYPRWDIHNREQALSVYMRYDSQRGSTVYIVSGARDDYIINQLQRCLRNGTESIPNLHRLGCFWILSRFTISSRGSPLSSQRAGEREELKKRTTDLSLLSQNVDSFITVFHMALGVASKLKHAHEEYFQSAAKRKSTNGSIPASGRLAYSIRWLNSSLESQLRWLHSYKARKDTLMTLVYNLVTQQDSSIMIQDSSSMKGIAILTMIFLPGTFTSSLLSCGILTATSHAHVDTTGLWWFWLALTTPLTFVVIGIFLLWYRAKQKGWDWKNLFRLHRTRDPFHFDAEKGLEKKRT